MRPNSRNEGMKFLDLHIHGAFGVDPLNADVAELDRLAQGLEARGYGSFLPTLIPLELDRLEPVVERLVEWKASRIARDGRGAMPLGLHFEGPFLSPVQAGALDPAHLLDGSDDRVVSRWLSLMDQLVGHNMITIAPEIKGGLDLIREMRRRGFLVSLGHTDAGIEDLERAVDAGARHMTHFCNAMRPLHHRQSGPIDFGLLSDQLSIDLIADGHHLSRPMMELILKVKNPAKIVLISDAIPATGQGDGVHEIWGETITVAGGTARNASGALSGSIALLQEGVTTLTALGLSRAAALACASSNALAALRAEQD